MITVSSAKFTKNFGRYRTAAHKEPVSVTSYGNEDLVVMAADEYKRLKARDQEALFAWELKPDDIAAIERDDNPESSKAFDDELDE